MTLILDPAHELYILHRIEQLERLHKAGDATYTDTFELNELLIRYSQAWRVHKGGAETTALRYFDITVIEGLNEEAS
jgi:hypothetical protein